jgi:hypothetical protein
VLAALLHPAVLVATVYLTASLLLLFALAMAINLLRGRREISCGCDPRGRPQPIRWALVARNVGYAGGVLVIGQALVTPAPLDVWALGVVAGLLVAGALAAITVLQSLPAQQARPRQGLV